MPEEKTRVVFNVPESLIEETNVIADVLDRSRTSLLVDALRDKLDDIVADEAFRRRIAEAYYADRIDFESLETVVGQEEALRIRLLDASLDRELPVPAGKTIDFPTDAAFYDGDLPTWTPDDESDDTAPTDR